MMPPRRESAVHARSLVRFGQTHRDVVVLSADLTSSTECEAFRDAFPDRFYSMGMAEQNMMSVAGGLAREGLVPLVHDFAVFMYRRALDQIELSVAYPNLPVKMLGFLPGISTHGGASHQAIDDLAVLASLPNMRVIECGDAADVESVLDVAYSIDGPVYVRMLRGSLERRFDSAMTLNRARVLVNHGDDVLVLSSGIAWEQASSAVSECVAAGLGVTHLQIGTLKPFTDPQVLDALLRTRLGVVTVENHLIHGGLGSATAVLMAENGVGVPLTRIGLSDTYAHGGSLEYLSRYYRLDHRAVMDAILRLNGESDRRGAGRSLSIPSRRPANGPEGRDDGL